MATRILPCQNFRSSLLATRFRLSAQFQTRYLSLKYSIAQPPNTQDDNRIGPLVFLHGLFGSKQNFRSISSTRFEDARICPGERPLFYLHIYKTRLIEDAKDLRNHGESPHDAIHNYTAMAGDVEDFIREYSLKKPILIGHSMGAKVAMTIALRSSDLLGALVSVDNAPVDVSLKSDFHKYIQGMREIEDANVEKATEADQILSRYEKALLIRQFLLTNLTKTPGEKALRFRIPVKTLASSLGYLGDFPFRDPDEACYKGPTLFVRGTKSDYVADDVLPAIGRFFPKFELNDIESGHWVISEKPEEFRQAILAFLQNHD